MTKNTTTNHQTYTSQDISNGGANGSHNKANDLNNEQTSHHIATFGVNMVSHLKAWLSALQQANALLPDHLRFKDINFDLSESAEGEISLSLISQLEALPVFSLSIVVQEQALTDDAKKEAFESHIKDWANQNALWQIISVPQTFTHLNDKSGTDRLTPVLTYRYILMPTQAETMQASKKTAASHLLDDSITSHLRQFIETLPITSDMGGDAAIDCHIVSLANMLRPHSVICFDMDSTLIEQEVIIELAKRAGCADEVTSITASAMRGEIDFQTSLIERMALLKGLPASALDEIEKQLTLTAGARTVIANLKMLGYHTVLVSGGFTYFAERIAKELGIDEVHANTLVIEDNIITGDISLPVMDGEQKALVVEKIAKQRGVLLDQVVCVGDGANDLSMLAKADLGIAYRAKPIVRSRADAAINATGLEGVLYVLGYAPEDFT